MMGKDFYRGQKLKRIFWGEMFLEVGTRCCADIEVVMENGQMAGVPWALITNTDGSQCKYNLALVEGVVLLDETS